MSNESVKTKKVVKRRLKFKGVLILALVLAGFVLLVKALLKVEVRSIDVTGNNYLKDSEIIKSAGLNNSVEFLKVRSKNVCTNLKENALVSTCKLKHKLDFSIEIIIEENIPLFYYNNDASIVLSDGTRSESDMVAGIPRLINYVPEDVLVEFISGLAKVKDDIIHSISEIEYSPSMSKDGKPIDNERFVLSMNDGNTIYINNRRMSNLDYYEKIYASLGDKKGTFNFDCDFDSILFKEYGE